MKFSCTQENLHHGLSAVSHIAGRNINLPILGNVLIKAEEKTLRLLSTNLEMAVMCAVRGKVEEQGEITVPSKLFADYVSLLPKERVDASLEGNAVAVSCGTFQTKLNGIPASEFPLIPTIEAKEVFIVKVAEIRKAIGQVLFAVAPNESRPEISGVLFKFSPTKDGLELILAATDSYRLAERTIKVCEGSTGIKETIFVIVPARAVAELIRILGLFKDTADSPADMKIQIGDNQILFSHDNVELISRTIEGKYPDYRQLVPDRFETEITLNKDELSRAVKTTSLFSKSGLNDIHIKFSAPSNIALSALNSQTGEHAVSLDGAVKGKENNITVNFRYFLDGVNNVESEDVVIQLVDGMSPCIIKPNDEDKADNDYLYIVMPIRH